MFAVLLQAINAGLITLETLEKAVQLAVDVKNVISAAQELLMGVKFMLKTVTNAYHLIKEWRCKLEFGVFASVKLVMLTQAIPVFVLLDRLWLAQSPASLV